MHEELATYFSKVCTQAFFLQLITGESDSYVISIYVLSLHGHGIVVQG